MAKLIVQHNEDPAIGIVLEEVPEGTPGRARGWHGECTECGWTLHYWREDNAVKGARRHIEKHESAL